MRVRLFLRIVLGLFVLSAAGLAQTLAQANAAGVLDVPADLRPDLARWVDLQVRSTAEDVTVLLSPLPVADTAVEGGPVHATSCVD